MVNVASECVARVACTARQVAGVAGKASVVPKSPTDVHTLPSFSRIRTVNGN